MSTDVTDDGPAEDGLVDDATIVYSTASDDFDAVEPMVDDEVVEAVSRGTRLSQAALTRRARDRDPDAFAALAREHEAEAVRMAFRMLGDRAEAQDVAAGALRRSWQQLPMSPSALTYRMWLSKAVMRECLRRLARTRPEPPVETGSAHGDEHGSDDLDDALDGLSAQHRACWVLKDIHGLSDDDIAYAVGGSTRIVSGRVKAARQQLISAMAA